MVNWIVQQYNMNSPASPEEVRFRARSLLEERSREQYHSSLTAHSKAGIGHFFDATGLSERIAENMPKSRLSAEHKHADR